MISWKFGVGASAALTRGRPHELSVVGSVDYALWSRYVDRHGEHPSDAGSEYDWKNVFSETVGVRHAFGALRSFFDVTFQPSPVPRQTGRTNYVDNDRIGATLGADFTIPVSGVKLRPGIQLQAYDLPRRYQAKDNAKMVDELPNDAVDGSGKKIVGAGGLQTNNPGWPGFASDGWVLGGAVTVALLY
jgi:long-chain fatty acid transport protein